jgi:hypothetical protein
MHLGNRLGRIEITLPTVGTSTGTSVPPRRVAPYATAFPSPPATWTSSAPRSAPPERYSRTLPRGAEAVLRLWAATRHGTHGLGGDPDERRLRRAMRERRPNSRPLTSR